MNSLRIVFRMQCHIAFKCLITIDHNPSLKSVATMAPVPHLIVKISF